jgi:hypothetical protein
MPIKRIDISDSIIIKGSPMLFNSINEISNCLKYDEIFDKDIDRREYFKGEHICYIGRDTDDIKRYSTSRESMLYLLQNIKKEDTDNKFLLEYNTNNLSILVRNSYNKEGKIICEITGFAPYVSDEVILNLEQLDLISKEILGC